MIGGGGGGQQEREERERHRHHHQDFDQNEAQEEEEEDHDEAYQHHHHHQQQQERQNQHFHRGAPPEEEEEQDEQVSSTLSLTTRYSSPERHQQQQQQQNFFLYSSSTPRSSNNHQNGNNNKRRRSKQHHDFVIPSLPSSNNPPLPQSSSPPLLPLPSSPSSSRTSATSSTTNSSRHLVGSLVSDRRRTVTATNSATTSSLMDLFAPPPTLTMNTTIGNQQQGINGIHHDHDSTTRGLTDLFSPPPPLPMTMTMTTTTNTLQNQKQQKRNHDERTPLLSLQQHNDEHPPPVPKPRPMADTLSPPPPPPPSHSQRPHQHHPMSTNSASAGGGGGGGGGGPQSPSRSRSPVGYRSLLWCKNLVSFCCYELSKPSTWIGSFMFVLFHVVFSLAMGSTIIRPHSSNNMLGAITKMASLGVIFGSPRYCIGLGHDIPAIYATVDLFTAPFFANIATIIDDTLYNDPTLSYTTHGDAYFLTTFTFVMVISLFISGTFLMLASIFKLANLGSYLPYPVLAGFFSAAGVMMWMDVFIVDSNGLSVGTLIQKGDWNITLNAILHHIPSVIVAISMKYLGPKHPFYVVMMVVLTVIVFYLIMFMFNISRQRMNELQWFWSSQDFIYNIQQQEQQQSMGFAVWAPPAPFGWINGLIEGHVHWGAVWASSETAIALSFLYLLRCSLHGTAMKKNVPNLQRIEKRKKRSTWNSNAHDPANLTSTRQVSVASAVTVKAGEHGNNLKIRQVSLGNALKIKVPTNGTLRQVSAGSAVTVQSEAEAAAAAAVGTHDDDTEMVIIKAKPTNATLKQILMEYGFSQFHCALIGSFPVTPSVAAASTMYLLGAENVAPQLGSVLLLSTFYLSDFTLVGYIPKPAFSSLQVLASIDILWTWFFKSYHKTKEKTEWLVVPLIVILAFVVGLLTAVWLGLAMSTFLFVASFFRSGVVKYIANGIHVRSTIERPLKIAKHLDQNGDLIQIFVLQNYLFFGNASSIKNYVHSMFEEPPETQDVDNSDGDTIAMGRKNSSMDMDDLDKDCIPPIPKVVVIDLTLVTGMDTSAVDAFSEILTSTSQHGCKLFLSGVGNDMRQVMLLGGFKFDSPKSGGGCGQQRSRNLRFFSNLDGAIGKAEDTILDEDMFEEIVCNSPSIGRRDGGLRCALEQVDEQHDTKFAEDLAALGQFTTVIEMDAGDILYQKHELERGLFFIEHGIVKIERNSEMTLSRVGNEAFIRMKDNNGTLNSLKARTIAIGKNLARMKANADGGMPYAAPLSLGEAAASRFRVARVGPGWVIGSIEALYGVQFPVNNVAVSDCRLHYISFKKIEEIETTDPVLVLALYKLLAYLMAKRQEITIGQLGTLHSIMSSPAQKKPMGRGRSFRTTTGKT